MKKVFSYDNYEGDKGIIIAESKEEAIEIYKKEYPNRKIATESGDFNTYYDNGCFIEEEEDWVEESRLIVACSW